MYLSKSTVDMIARFVVIAMEAMDQLLVACHAQTLNLFVESFLRIVQKLLESMEPELQILATQSVSDIQKSKIYYDNCNLKPSNVLQASL